jgi:hypothetical protein
MGEIKRFGRWVRRVRAKYFSSKSEFAAGVAALEDVLNTVDALIPDRIDGKVMIVAREAVDKLKEGVKYIPEDGDVQDS